MALPIQHYDSNAWRTIQDPDWEILQAARPSKLTTNLIAVLDTLFGPNSNPTVGMIHIILSTYIFRGIKTEQEYTDYKGGVLFTYIENKWETMTRANMRSMCVYEPRLKSFEVADCFLNSANIDAVRGMEDAGYIPDENLAKQIYCSIIDWYGSDYHTQQEDDEKVLYLTPSIEYLVSCNLGHIIDMSVFDFAREHQNESVSD